MNEDDNIFVDLFSRLCCLWLMASVIVFWILAFWGLKVLLKWLGWY